MNGQPVVDIRAHFFPEAFHFYFDTISHAPDALRYLIGVAGAERVMLGSDYCFDMGYEDPVGVLDGLELSAADRARILGGNAVRLLGLA